ncbi:hypothetical protein [Aureispira anguillae]|uniref:HTH cro/C1-type domain-containing protein n=1 Tax=Aureispira anguillae TaxID=2864201 RepID=A0A915YH78_9BACT|nr:hypothetical protein [Aureispira anguillae]BDS12888.1 hypothetical protein AsAng_0036130 [Aureispira anguillae]
MKEGDIKLHSRLITVLNYLGCDKNVSKFARGLGVNSQNISNIYRRKTIPNLNLVAKIATHYPDKVNYHWLLTGTGVMIKNVIEVEADPRIKDMIQDRVKEYKNELERSQNQHLLDLQKKDELIISLQQELSATKQKTIELLEKYLEG